MLRGVTDRSSCLVPADLGSADSKSSWATLTQPHISALLQLDPQVPFSHPQPGPSIEDWSCLPIDPTAKAPVDMLMKTTPNVRSARDNA